MRFVVVGLIVLLGCDGRIGAPCEAASDCRSSTVCRDWPGGYCTGPCVRDEECGAEGACVEEDDRGGSCLRRCGPETPCRPGYACRATLEAIMVCWPD